MTIEEFHRFVQDHMTRYPGSEVVVVVANGIPEPVQHRWIDRDVETNAFVIDVQ